MHTKSPRIPGNSGTKGFGGSVIADSYVRLFRWNLRDTTEETKFPGLRKENTGQEEWVVLIKRANRGKSGVKIKMGNRDQPFTLPNGNDQVVWVKETGELFHEPGGPGFILPGSFNPLHQGHLGLFSAAQSVLQGIGGFEITICNVDKPLLDERAILSRLSQFRGLAPVVITRAGTFLSKARLFPGTIFVVGFDTAARVVDPRFYEDSPSQMNSSLEEFRGLGCSFLVAGRINAKGEFQTLNDLPIPLSLEPLFQAIPADQFRLDISSTQLRQQS